MGLCVRKSRDSFGEDKGITNAHRRIHSRADQDLPDHTHRMAIPRKTELYIMEIMDKKITPDYDLHRNWMPPTPNGPME
eukprot:scaffold182616_cov54-Attheya_sp.AAC.4